MANAPYQIARFAKSSQTTNVKMSAILANPGTQRPATAYLAMITISLTMDSASNQTTNVKIVNIGTEVKVDAEM